jgi:aspartate racemase
LKTIGMIGGMSWESSIEYYRIVNEAVKEKLGGLHSARCLMYSVDFAKIATLQREGCWEQATRVMVVAAHAVEVGEADFLIIGTNTMHRMAEKVQTSIGIPFLHIADVTAEVIRTRHLR